jgi:hypothetical protein
MVLKFERNTEEENNGYVVLIGLSTESSPTPFYSRLSEQIFKDDVNSFSSTLDLCLTQ